jgi:hypothetical protein
MASSGTVLASRRPRMPSVEHPFVEITARATSI